ncbi:cysteine peptidase family C39 domain-containing protein [Pedosphaera parvula]|uniref:Peptidase C39 bacteriocin processing n=1 Tax=Pedosphaera parvula (strain Ellin514) TaxID=320771 RepID=B9XIA1_PEDPL|nr:cysteine peptidase family C39 domain-containing protein [Pedosphaera parvula]EEF60362.1 peptidase C39 bacteriocin processing [Pedosphaera parvula Ellin514]
MSPWLESSGVALLAAGGVLLGAWFSRLRKPYWLFGYFIPISLIFLYALAIRHPDLSFTPPVSWMMLGRTKFAMIGFLGSMVLTTPLLKLPNLRDRIAVSLLMVGVVAGTSVWPFLAPAFNREELASLKTRIDSDGICLQTTSYTCGPASAVTALRRLGIQAEEGQLALLAHTTSATGTPPDVLALELEKQYASSGLICKYGSFKSIAELKGCDPAIAVVKFNIVTDHYVTVLEVNDREVVVGDPLSGMEKLSYEEFKDKWRFVGIILKRR